MLIEDLEPGDVVAQIDRQIETRFGLQRALGKFERVSPIARLLRSSARTMPCAGPSVAARSTPNLQIGRSGSRARRARAPRRAPVTSATCGASAASFSANSRAWPRARPSAIQTTSVFGAVASNLMIGATSAKRSGTYGRGLIGPQPLERMRRIGEADLTSAIRGRDKADKLAAPRRRVDTLFGGGLRTSQFGAAGQPSSITSAAVPPPVPAGKGLSTGPAMARMIAAAIARRSASSHQGVWAASRPAGADRE